MRPAPELSWRPFLFFSFSFIFFSFFLFFNSLRNAWKRPWQKQVLNTCYTRHIFFFFFQSSGLQQQNWGQVFLHFFCCFCVDRSDSESTYCGRLFTHRCAPLLIQRTHILPYRVLLVRCGGNTTNRDGINKEKEGKTTHTHANIQQELKRLKCCVCLLKLVFLLFAVWSLLSILWFICVCVCVTLTRSSRLWPCVCGGLLITNKGGGDVGKANLKTGFFFFFFFVPASILFGLVCFLSVVFLPLVSVWLCPVSSLAIWPSLEWSQLTWNGAAFWK